MTTSVVCREVVIQARPIWTGNTGTAKRTTTNGTRNSLTTSRQSAGFICHCNKPLFQAILDFLAITLVILFVSILVPALNWLAFSYPLAFVVDWLFGDTLRKETPYCDEDVRKNPNLTLQQCKEERESSGIDYELLALFLTPLGIACASFILRRISSKWQHLFSLFFHFSAGFFALVFFPWFIK